MFLRKSQLIKRRTSQVFRSKPKVHKLSIVQVNNADFTPINTRMNTKASEDPKMKDAVKYKHHIRSY